MVDFFRIYIIYHLHYRSNIWGWKDFSNVSKRKLLTHQGSVYLIKNTIKLQIVKNIFQYIVKLKFATFTVIFDPFKKSLLKKKKKWNFIICFYYITLHDIL